MDNLSLFGSWLTVNRYCNFRCVWCYAQESGYRAEDDMDPRTALSLIDLEKDLGIKNVIFIGGEPTLWKHLFKTSVYVKEKGMTSYLVTNGSMFANQKFIEKLQKSPFDNITVSLKAGNIEQHRTLTGTSFFSTVARGIKNLRDNCQKFDVSITLNSLIKENLSELVNVAADAGAKGVKIEFCASTFRDDQPDMGCMMHPKEVVNCVIKYYKALNELMEGNIFFEISNPLCLWPKDFIAALKQKGQILSGCHVLRREGLIFDPYARILPCNTLHNYPLGQYGIDFTDAKSFALYWRNPSMVEFYDRIITYPSRKCIECEVYDECGGGCPLQWFIFNPEEIIVKECERW